MERGARAHARAASTTSSPFIGEMLLQHEHQHNETMLQTLQLAEPGVYAPRARRGRAAAAAAGSVAVAARPVEIGFEGDGFAYDNERPRHRVELPAYRIDRAPVTNAQFLEFVEDGGYAAPRAVVARRAGRCASARAGSGRCTGPPTASERRFDSHRAARRRRCR